jgi:hypothetical protein
MSVVAFRIERPVSAVQPQANMANVVPFRRPPEQLRKRELLTGAGGVRALNVERTALTATAASGGTSRWSGRRVAINDFAHNGRSGHPMEKREALTTENEVCQPNEPSSPVETGARIVSRATLLRSGTDRCPSMTALRFHSHHTSQHADCDLRILKFDQPALALPTQPPGHRLIGAPDEEARALQWS